MNLKTGGRGDPPPHDNVLRIFSLGSCPHFRSGSDYLIANT